MYQVRSITRNFKARLRQYLEADYHIWDESLITQRRELLDRDGVISNEPYLEATPRYRKGKPFSELRLSSEISRLFQKLSSIPKSGVYAIPRQHQCEALEHFLTDGDELIISTGTGSGKTESFLYPILGSMTMEGVEKRSSVDLSAMRVLLLYPMNALVNDQLGRLRRLFGNEDVAQEIEIVRGRRVTFGVYTSRTDYPGERKTERDQKLKTKLAKLYLGNAIRKRSALQKEGLWPSKNIESFVAQDLHSSRNDSEKLTRQEMQSEPPDVLVTNYSMLEYMLARPIERGIFEKTSEWLKADPANYLTVVLDEAHVYRGLLALKWLCSYVAFKVV